MNDNPQTNVGERGSNGAFLNRTAGRARMNLVNPYLFDTSGGGGGGGGYTASGAGNSAWNGTYVPDGTNTNGGGRLRYKKLIIHRLHRRLPDGWLLAARHRHQH
jgi:hypothetical protein